MGMEYADAKGREIVVRNLEAVLGQWPYHSPDVFNFYHVGHQPASYPTGIVAPEFQIFTPPFAAGFHNGMLSLIDGGLNHCNGGFHMSLYSCSEAEGNLTYKGAATAEKTLAE